MSRALIALGSNLGDRRRAIESALAEICRLPRTCVVESSSLRETAPVGGPKQGDFLNAAALVETQLAPGELLEGLLGIERSLGRIRRELNGPRTIDLDIILYDERVVKEPGLEVPHPRFRDRPFVLEPLAEIAPDAVDPVTRKTVRELLAMLPLAP
jgi:2-amino-4-hydroxy-6-hydroxymethyldihydropteridine diphosphokinase